MVRSAGATVNVSELLPNVQKQSARLQAQAEKALAAGDYHSAEQLFADAIHLTPSTASIANNLGVIALRRRDVDTAVRWIQKASEEAPYRADILGNLGLVRWMQHRDEESYGILLEAFSRGYESNVGHYILGRVGLEKGASKDSVDHLKKVRPDRFPDRDLYLSIALRDCGKTEAADKAFRNFLRRHRAPFLISSYR
jgi:tetratricopeptide (TPR) repeat protein